MLGLPRPGLLLPADEGCSFWGLSGPSQGRLLGASLALAGNPGGWHSPWQPCSGWHPCRGYLVTHVLRMPCSQIPRPVPTPPPTGAGRPLLSSLGTAELAGWGSWGRQVLPRALICRGTGASPACTLPLPPALPAWFLTPEHWSPGVGGHVVSQHRDPTQGCCWGQGRHDAQQELGVLEGSGLAWRQGMWRGPVNPLCRPQPC